MNIYQNILNNRFYTTKIVKAIPAMIEATPYMMVGEKIKYPVASAEANYFVKLSLAAIAAYNNTKNYE